MTTSHNEPVEELAALEHRQWMHWTQNLADREELPEHLLDRWEENWRPYEDLDDATKEHDRKWAREVIELLESSVDESAFRVCCDECDAVRFEGLARNRFEDDRDANYYAGVHDATEHPTPEFRFAYVEEVDG